MKQSDQYLEEHVLVFPSELLKTLGYFQGLSFDVEKYLRVILDPANTHYMQRKDAETDPSFKQIIPYVVLHHGDRVFSYRRGKLQAEKRLLGNYSIGVGGHISVHDPALFGSTYQEGLKREVNEEIQIGSPYTERVAALLNDDSNDVGKVHFGIVHTFSLETPAVEPKEKSINEPAFVGKDELRAKVEAYENWSRICIENLDRLLK